MSVNNRSSFEYEIFSEVPSSKILRTFYTYQILRTIYDTMLNALIQRKLKYIHVEKRTLFLSLQLEGYSL